MDRLNNILKKHREKPLYLVIIVVFILLLFIVWLLTKDDAKPASTLTTGSIDQPFNYDDGIKVNLSDSVLDKSYDSKYGVYDFVDVDHSNNIGNFLRVLGKGLYQKRSFDNIYYIWSKDINEDFYIVDYDNVTQSLFFRFADPVDLDSILPAGIEENNYFTQLYKLITNTTESFTNIKIEELRDGSRITANRIIDNLPLYLQGFEDHSDYVLLDGSGRLKEGRFTLIGIDYDSKVDLDIVQLSLLGAAINRADYPKDYIEKAPLGLELEDLGYDAYKLDSSGKFLGDPPPISYVDEISSPESCVVKTAQLVYYFIRNTTEKLTPVYRLECEGEITVREVKYTVPVIIFANAIDPEYVYIPADKVDE